VPAQNDVTATSAPSLSAAPAKTGGVKFTLDELQFDAATRRMRVRGWAFPSAQPLFRREVTVVLVGRLGAYRIATRRLIRPDVRVAFKTPWLAQTGFCVTTTLPSLPPGDYQVGLELKCSRLGEDLRNAAVDLRSYFEPPRQNGYALKTLEELDEELRHMAAAHERSFAEWLGHSTQFHLEEDTQSLPLDPLSAEYRDAQVALYRRVSGRDGYNPWTSEPIEIAVDVSADPYPFPYSTKEAGYVGSHMLAMGHILRVMKAAVPNARSVLEYGCGTGFTTIVLAQTGFDVVAVDINAQALQVVDRLAATRGLQVTTFNGVFGQVPDAGNRWDVVLFYESFHHCLDFQKLLQRLHELLAEGGAVIFAGEPISRDFAKPWGLRLDGLSLWEIRTKGWLELGFRQSFFLELLERTGWRATKHSQQNAPDIYVAKRKPKPAKRAAH
jgi:SAM-dependent methyltransferase